MNDTITLRYWQESDAPRVLELFNNLNVTRGLTANLPRPYELQHAQDFVQRCAAAGESCLERAIDRNGQTVGTVGCRVTDGLALIGYWLGEPYWGKRIMSRALPLYIEQLPATVTQLKACTFAFNTASQALLRRCGFTQQEDTFTERAYDRNIYTCYSFTRAR